jgi:enoyl-CoA hydratase/carnithine racemase
MGGFPGAGGPVRLPAIVGRAHALEIICSGRQVHASEMARVGLALAVHPTERLMIEARALAETITASGPLATRGAKRIVNTRLTSGFAAARALSDALRAAVECAKTSTRARQRTLKRALRVLWGVDAGFIRPESQEQSAERLPSKYINDVYLAS